MTQSHFTKDARTKKQIQICVMTGVIMGLIATSACLPKGDAKAITPKTSDQAEVPSRPDNRPVQRDVNNAEKATLARATPAVSSKPESVAAGLDTGIAGGWVNAGGACDSGASVFFNPDGTYLSEGEKGTWALSGKTLTVTTATTTDEDLPARQGPDESTGDSGEKAVLTLLSVTNDAARVVLSNGANANWTRCAG